MKTTINKIPWAKPTLFGAEKEYLLKAVESTWISGGPFVEELERRFISIIGSPYGTAVSNGTTALQLAILALELGKGDEVIVPGFTFVAPVNMIIAAGATPVYADIDAVTWCIDPSSIEQKLTCKTKAILPVHLYGNVCDMERIMRLAGKHQLFVIEDTAESCFSRYGKQYAGTFGDVGCFSFQATKTITTGEGGFVVTSDEALHKKMRRIRDHGMKLDKRYWHDVIGFNFRLTNLQASLGCSQLDHLDQILLNRRRMFEVYKKHLKRIKGVVMQHLDPHVDPVIWAIAIKIDPLIFGMTRDELMKELTEKGIETRPGFYTFHDMPLYQGTLLRNCQEVSGHVISLPSFPSISETEIAYVCDQLGKYSS